MSSDTASSGTGRRRLRGRTERPAQVNPVEFAALAEHLDVPEVLAQVEVTALRLLAAFQASDHRHQSYSCSP